MTVKKREVGKRYFFTYYDVEYDENGWASSEFHPLSFDMVTLQIQSSNGKNKEINGWWTGSIWEGLHLRKDDKVVAWKLNNLSEIQMSQCEFPYRKKKLKELILGTADKIKKPKKIPVKSEPTKNRRLRRI